MANQAQLEVYEKILTSTLTRTIDFVKFAEAKNAALLTFSSVWTLASIGIITGDKSFSFIWSVAFKSALPLFTFSAIISILSFLPRTALDRFMKDPGRDKSLLFFGDAAEFEPSAFRDRFRKRYLAQNDEVVFNENLLDDLSIQILANSKIASRKFHIFNIGAVMVLLGMLVLSFAALQPFILFVFSFYASPPR